MNLGGGGGGGGGGAAYRPIEASAQGLFEPPLLARPKAVRAYPPPVAAAAAAPIPAAAPPVPAPPLARRPRGMAFNMANLEEALPPLNLGPAAAGGAAAAPPPAPRGNSENEFRHRKTRKLNRAL